MSTYQIHGCTDNLSLPLQSDRNFRLFTELFAPCQEVSAIWSKILSTNEKKNVAAAKHDFLARGPIYFRLEICHSQKCQTENCPRSAQSFLIRIDQKEEDNCVFMPGRHRARYQCSKKGERQEQTETQGLAPAILNCARQSTLLSVTIFNLKKSCRQAN